MESKSRIGIIFITKQKIMNLLTKFKSGLMTLFAGIENNNGTTPTTLPQPNLEPNAYKNPNGSTLDLQDSGPTNVPDSKHKQVYTPTNKYLDNI
jgi:hypothetical protein